MTKLSSFSSALADKLLARDTSPKEWTVLLWLMELLALLVISNPTLSTASVELQHLIRVLPTSHFTVILLLGCCLLVQLTLKMCILRGLYCPLIFIAAWNFDWVSGISAAMLAASVLLECIRTSDRCFFSNSLTAELHNSLKLLHFIVVSMIVTAYGLFGCNSLSVNCSCFVAALGMLIARIRSQTLSHNYKIMSEVLYVQLLISSLFNIISVGVTLSVILTLTLQTAVVVLYALVRAYQTYRRPKLHKKSRSYNPSLFHLEVLLSKLAQPIFNQDCIDQAALMFHYRHEGSQLKATPDTNQQQFWLEFVLNFLEYFKDSSREPEYLLVKAYCSYYIKQERLSALHILLELGEVARWYHVCTRLFTYRLRREIERNVTFSWSKLEGIDERFYQHESFRGLLTRCCYLNRSWWESLADNNTVASSFVSISRQLLSLRREVEPAYSRLFHKTRYLVDMYFFYLYYVEKNLDKAYKLLPSRQFYASIYLEYQWTDSLYLEISADPRSFGQIEDISANCLGLLGRHRAGLIGESIGELVPRFYRYNHEQAMRYTKEQGYQHHLHSDVLVVDKSDNFHDATLWLSVWAKDNQVSFRGHMKFSPDRREVTHIVFNKTSGELLGGTERLPCNVCLNIETLANYSLEEVLSKLYSGGTVEFKYNDTNLGKEFALLRVINYEDQEAIAVVSRSSESPDFEPDNSSMHKSIYTKPAIRNKCMLKEDSSLWELFKHKHATLDNEKCPVLPQVGGLWLLAVGFLCCSVASVFSDYSVHLKKEDYNNRLHNIMGMEILLYDLLVWTRYVDFRHHFDLTVPSVDYNNLTDVGTKAIQLNMFLQNLSSPNTTVVQYTKGEAFQMESRSFLISIASEVELIAYHYLDDNPDMDQMTQDHIDYVIYNWKEASGTAVQQIKDQLYYEYLYTKDNYARTKILLLVLKCVLTVGVTALLILADVLRRRRREHALRALMEVSQEVAGTELVNASCFERLLCGKGARQSYEPFLMRSLEKGKRKSYILCGDTFLQSSIVERSCSSFSDSINGLATSSRMRPLNMMTTEYGNTKKRNRLPMKQKRPNVFFLAVVVAAAALAIAVSTISYVATLSNGYPLQGYVVNAFSLEARMGSFSRLGLSFLAHLDPADAYQVFPEELVNYRKAMETDIVYDVTLMEYSEFAYFNRFKDAIDTKPLCTYTSCKYFTDAMNITRDNGYHNRLTFMIDVVENSRDSGLVLKGQEFQYLVEFLRLLFQSSLDQFRIYANNVYDHLDLVFAHQMTLYEIEIGCVAGLIASIIVPISYMLIASKREDTELLNIISEEAYAKEYNGTLKSARATELMSRFR